ncbi:unnamed protein product [Protopolystoma xenopodis]|uniref:Uncharacterized protein n=1 Tax=Protopolystoma xenopodis TaxID=117903 RepID=A0A3S5CR78_9PLAT|nr:unnamed protein product [Protopolystoma xenopodis]
MTLQTVFPQIDLISFSPRLLSAVDGTRDRIVCINHRHATTSSGGRKRQLLTTDATFATSQAHRPTVMQTVDSFYRTCAYNIPYFRIRVEFRDYQ